MQIARYDRLQHGADNGGSEHRRRATPAERILEGELLRGDRREGRERRHGAESAEPGPTLASYRVEPPPPQAPVPGNNAIAAYLRAADPGRFAPTAHLHIVV